jgi:hypothetical protein
MRSSVFLLILFGILLPALVFIWRRSRQRSWTPEETEEFDKRLDAAVERADRALAKMEPFWRREVVEAKVKSQFPNQTTEALRLLDQYESESPGRERVQLAILKLSGSSLNKLRDQVDTAKRDYREVLLLGETPESFRMGEYADDSESFEAWAKADEAEQAVEAKEFEDYLQWLQQK